MPGKGNLCAAKIKPITTLYIKAILSY